MKTQQKNKNPSYWTEAQNLASGNSIAPSSSVNEELAPQLIKSVNATILQIKGHIITVRVPSAELAGLVGKDIKINGLKTIRVHSVPSSEADNFKTDLTNALVYRIPDEDSTSSLTVASACELTWH